MFLSLEALSRMCNIYRFAQGEICGEGCEKPFSLMHKDVNFGNCLTDDERLESSFDEIMCLRKADSARIIPHSTSTVVSNGD